MSAEISTPERGSWLHTLRSGRPHQVIRCERGDYLHRRFLLPPNRWGNVHLHLFIYLDVTEHGAKWRGPGSLAYQPAHHRHRVQLLCDAASREPRAASGPCLSVVIAGAHQQGWGFFCPRADGRWRFIPWRDFAAGGCGEPD